EVNVANVETAMNRWKEAVKNNRTYEQQLAFEEANGKRVQRLTPDFAKEDLASIARFAVQATVQFGAGADQILEFIVPQLESNGRNVEELTKLFTEPQAAAQAQAVANDNDVIGAGLVGGGGGGLTAMTFAAREGDLESTTLLVAAGANIDQTTEYGWTPLLTATNNRHYRL